jgi:hypothetical protein
MERNCLYMYYALKHINFILGAGHMVLFDSVGFRGVVRTNPAIKR